MTPQEYIDTMENALILDNEGEDGQLWLSTKGELELNKLREMAITFCNLEDIKYLTETLRIKRVLSKQALTV